MPYSKNIISHNYRYIYLVMPKVACVSIRQLLAKIEGKEWVQDGDNISTSFDFVTSSKASKYCNYFKFSFVRNPWDRLVSCYFNKVNAKPHKYVKKIFKHHQEVKEDMSFKDFILLVSTLSDEKSNIHFMSQSKIINYRYLDFIGRFESLQKDMSYVCNKIGHPEAINIFPHSNTCKHLYYRDYYDDETINLVSKRFKEDIEIFNYEF